jgi:hypothetical protein
MKNDLTPEALEGYTGQTARYLSTSPAWYAYHLGLYLYATGRTTPRSVSMSRGANIRANGLMFKHTGPAMADGNVTNRQQFDRVE